MKYKTPPLPFLGNKTRQLKNIDEVLTNMQYAGLINEKTIFYDVFGGSGLISHHIKQRFKNNRVIWNDYDDYQSRLNLIDKTNEIKEKIIKSVGKFKDDRLDDDEKMKIRAILDEYDENELDFITLSVYFIFAGNYAKNKEHLKEKIKYNRFVLKPLCKKGYLDGVERVRMDFEKLILSIPQEQIEKQEAFLILDPPYLQTTQNQYCSHFTSKEFFRMIELIFKPFILFSSEKSGILPFIENYQKYDKKGLFDDYLFDKEKAKIGSEDYIIYHCKRKGLFEEV